MRKPVEAMSRLTSRLCRIATLWLEFRWMQDCTWPSRAYRSWTVPCSAIDHKYVHGSAEVVLQANGVSSTPLRLELNQLTPWVHGFFRWRSSLQTGRFLIRYLCRGWLKMMAHNPLAFVMFSCFRRTFIPPLGGIGMNMMKHCLFLHLPLSCS